MFCQNMLYATSGGDEGNSPLDGGSDEILRAPGRFRRLARADYDAVGQLVGVGADVTRSDNRHACGNVLEGAGIVKGNQSWLVVRIPGREVRNDIDAKRHSFETTSLSSRTQP